MLFVNAGLDVSRPLATQKDSFWWASGGFERLSEPYGEFARIVRGFDQRADGLVEGEHTISLDGGAGRGGTLIAACIDADGKIVESLEI